MSQLTLHSFTSVYGPVQSWRFGRSLGIDPIGPVSICSFNCAYCQLGEIEYRTNDRQLLIPTDQIQRELQAFDPWDVDVITLSGSGEPTLALNLGEILTMVKAMTAKPVVVLTNGTLLANPFVQQELAIADFVSVKFDAISTNQLNRVNRPLPKIDLVNLWASLLQFRQKYPGRLGIQTMMLTPWTEIEQAEYITLMAELQPDEIQLNTPTRPKPLQHHLDARGNHTATPDYPVQFLKPVQPEVLQMFADRVESSLTIPVSSPPLDR